MQDKLSAVIRLIRLDRPIGTFLLFWPTLWALWIAGEGWPDAHIVLIMTLGVIVMRAAGCAINDYADRKIDGQVARTKNRPLANGELSAAEALVTFFVLILVALLLVLQLNLQSIYIAVLSLGIAAFYPFSKRFTYLPQFILGLAFSMSILMSFTALNNSKFSLALVLLLANLLWVVAYDTIYAMVDREDDLKIGIKSTAILFGHYDKLMVLAFGIGSLLTLASLGRALDFGVYFYASLFLAFLNLLYQQWLIRQNKTDLTFQAFLSNNWFGAFVFCGLVLQYLS